MTIPEQVRPAHEHWEAFLNEHVDFQLKTSEKHTKEHCARVLLYCLMIADQMNISSAEKEILCMAAVFHDSRRQDDWLDVGHGQRAADYYRDYSKSGKLPFRQLCYDIMAYHDRDDALGIDALKKLEASEPNAVLLYQIFKDADALDRFRLGPGGLDTKYLRTEAAKSLYPYAKMVWEQYSDKTV